jgi:hypothetical protein
MRKSEVYSWRVAPTTKAALESEARREHQSMAALLERIAEEWLEARRRAEGADDGAEQRRLHAAAARAIGTISGRDPRRSERVRRYVRVRLKRLRRAR